MQCCVRLLHAQAQAANYARGNTRPSLLSSSALQLPVQLSSVQVNAGATKLRHWRLLSSPVLAHRRPVGLPARRGRRRPRPARRSCRRSQAREEATETQRGQYCKIKVQGGPTRTHVRTTTRSIDNRMIANPSRRGTQRVGLPSVNSFYLCCKHGHRA